MLRSSLLGYKYESEHIKDIDTTFVTAKIFCSFCRHLPTVLNRASDKMK